MFSTVTTRDDGKYLIIINCPACGGSRVQALIWDHREAMRLLGVIPYINARTTWVLCTNCNQLLFSRHKCADVLGVPPEGLTGVIYHRIPFTHHVMALGALLLSIAPGAGLLVAPAAAFYNRKCPTWPRPVSFLALGFTIVAQSVYAVLIFGS